MFSSTLNHIGPYSLNTCSQESNLHPLIKIPHNSPTKPGTMMDMHFAWHWKIVASESCWCGLFVSNDSHKQCWCFRFLLIADFVAVFHALRKVFAKRRMWKEVRWILRFLIPWAQVLVSTITESLYYNRKLGAVT